MPEKRISLSKKQLATDAGSDLLSLLRAVTADGQLSDGEVEQLKQWLDAHSAADEIPAIAWLRDLVGLVLADGKVTKEERAHLVFAIERVLPQEDRSAAKRARASQEPATDRQIAYLQALNAEIPEGLTKPQASQLIDELKSIGGNATPRQMMLLRFWDEVRVAEFGKHGVSDWIDAWHHEDPDRRSAWDLWNRENPQLQSQSASPDSVELGCGKQYLERILADRAEGMDMIARRQAQRAAPTGRKREAKGGCLGWLIIGAIAFAWWKSKQP